MIPKAFRDRHEIKPGDEVLLLDSQKGLLVVPVPADPIEAARGMLKKYITDGGPSLTEELLEERRRTLHEEESGLPPPPPGQKR